MSFLGVFKTALTKMVCKKITPFSGCACSIGEGGGGCGKEGNFKKPT